MQTANQKTGSGTLSRRLFFVALYKIAVYDV